MSVLPICKNIIFDPFTDAKSEICLELQARVLKIIKWCEN